MDSTSQFGFEISEMLDKIMENDKNKLSQKTKVYENAIAKEKKALNTFNYCPPKTMIADHGNYFSLPPNFGPSGLGGNRVGSYQNFAKPIEPNPHVPSVGPNAMNLDQTANIASINQVSSHLPNINHLGLRDSEHYSYPTEYPLTIKPNYLPKTQAFNPINHNQFPVIQMHQENNANAPLPFLPPARPLDAFYFNPPGVIIPGSLDKVQKRSDNDSFQLDKKRKKRKSSSGSSFLIPVCITALPPPPSPPNLAPQPHCHTPPYHHSYPLTPPGPSSPGKYSPHFKGHSPIHSKAPPLPPPPTLQVPPLPSSPPPPDFDNLMNKPPEPKEPPPESPLKKAEDYSSYNSVVLSTKSVKKERKKSTKTKPFKSSITVENEFLNIKPLNTDERSRASNADKFCGQKKRKKYESYEDPNWKKVDSKLYHGIPQPNFVPIRGKFSYLDEPPPFNPVAGVPPRDVGGGPPFNPVSRGPLFPPTEVPTFSPMRGKPFSSMERPPFIARGRPPFNVMGGPPPSFPPMGGGPPPFVPMGTGPLPFHPLGTGPPPFQPMRGGPRFQPIGENFSFHSTKMPPFNVMGEGPPFDSAAAGVGYEEELEFEEFSNEDHDSRDTEYKHTEDRKHMRNSRRTKRTKCSRERGTVEHKKDSKSARMMKHTSTATKAKETKPRKKDVKLKAKKKIVDYELEPGEYISDLESGNNCASSREFETESEFSDKRKFDSEGSTYHSDVSQPEFGRHWRKPSKFDNYTEAKHHHSDESDSSEMSSEPPDITEKPKYPRYFKDKVAYISDTPKIFDDETGSTSGSKVSKESQSGSRKKAEYSDNTKKPLSPPITSESLKATKTPLIKRLGLADKRADTHTYESSTHDYTESKSTKGDEKVNPNCVKSFAVDHEHFNNTCSDKDDTEAFKSLHSPSNMDSWNQRNRSNSLSPNNSLDSEEVRLLASTKEILSASKSIFKSPTSPKIATTKKRYEKPIIKVETASKPDPFIRQVEESPHRIDLDSRIKIMFGMKSSGEEDSPEKRSLRNAALSHKSMRLLSRPPSPFRSRNAYQFWHRETYYFRKHNPLPKDFSDPTNRRKIGIQIKELNDGLVDFKIENPPTRVDDYIALSNPSSAEKVGDVAVKSLPASSEPAEEEIKSLIAVDKRPLPASPSEGTECATNNILEICNEVTKVDILPNAEVELISEESEQRLTEIVSNCDILDKFNMEEISESDVVKLVLSKIIDELKRTIKNKLTEDVINEKLEF